jgi:hypothetical protein
MRHLCNILDKIDAGSEAAIREHLDTALGVWSARKGASHKIVAVSESSVAFADGEANLFVAHYVLTEGKVVLTDCRRLLNVQEEISNTSFIDEFAAKFVDLVAEDQEEQASKLIGAVLEMKQRAVAATKLVEQKEGAASRAAYLKESKDARFRLIQEAKKAAKIRVFKKAGVLRRKCHEDTKSAKAIGSVLEAAVNMLTALELAKRDPLIEGFIIEKAADGSPTVIRAKGASTLVKLIESDDDDADDKPWEKGEKKDDDDKDDKKKDDKDDDDKHEKGESDKEEKDEHKGKSEKEEDKEDKKDDDKKRSDEGVIVVNLKTLNETADPRKDFFYRAAVAWKSFRADPVTETTAELIKNHSTAAAIVEAAPFLALLGEDEVYEAIAPHIDAFDPSEIRAVAKSIVAEGATKDGQEAKNKFLVSLGDNEIVEAIKTQKLLLSEQLDHLFLEGDDFDFGAADNLGNDDLSDDQSTDGMDDANQEGEDDLMGDDDLTAQGDEMGDEEGEQIQFSMSADKAREMLKKVLDVVGDEIEDSDEFNDLKAKVDGTADGEDTGMGGGEEQPELTGDDITQMLQVIGDYFDAVGKDKTDQDEANAEDEMGGETLDDMSNLGDAGGDEAGAEGDQGAPGAAGEQQPAAGSDDLNLGG